MENKGGNARNGMEMWVQRICGNVGNLGGNTKNVGNQGGNAGNQDRSLKVVPATFLIICFFMSKRSLVKQGRMFFISPRKLFSFLR